MDHSVRQHAISDEISPLNLDEDSVLPIELFPDQTSSLHMDLNKTAPPLVQRFAEMTRKDRDENASSLVHQSSGQPNRTVNTKSNVVNHNSINQQGNGTLNTKSKDELLSVLAVSAERDGMLLKKLRTCAGLELADLEKSTRINLRNLMAIESNRWEELPAPIYVRGFIQSYLRCLGIDSKSLVDEIMKNRQNYERKSA